MNCLVRLNLIFACAALHIASCAPTSPDGGQFEPTVEAQQSASSSEAEPATADAVGGQLPSAPATEVAPDPSDERIALAEAALSTSKFIELRSIAEAILEDHPQHGYARLLLGLSLHKQLRYERAIPEFEAVIRGGASFEKYDAAWHFLGWALYNTGRLELARGAFEKHLLAAPDEGDSFFALGLIEVDQGNEDAALTRFQRSIELNLLAVKGGNQSRTPDVAKAHVRIADIYLARDQPEDAVRELERCVTMWPPHYAAWFKLYRAHTLLGNDDLAAASMKQHDHWKAQANQELKPDAAKQ